MKAQTISIFRFFFLASLLTFAACRRRPQTDPGDILADDLRPGGAGLGTLDGEDWGIPFEDDAHARGDFINRTPVNAAIAPVYFAFDSYRVAPGEVYKVQQAADHLRTNPSHVVIVEGHTDERGSREYNLALGERRALAVRESLVGFGISPERIQTLTYGEEQPAVMGSGESAWSQNRRSEFRIMR
ncbi:MAG: OmpA family protein [Verrucomicrobia bacterium]|nr:OmpA family protein [Verrucomicrobiota bacterium]MCH8510634.1 OmpA family protein [Kiritimatiellia bacterium]